MASPRDGSYPPFRGGCPFRLTHLPGEAERRGLPCPCRLVSAPRVAPKIVREHTIRRSPGPGLSLRLPRPMVSHKTLVLWDTAEGRRAMLESCVRDPKKVAYPESDHHVGLALDNEEIRRDRADRSPVPSTAGRDRSVDQNPPFWSAQATGRSHRAVDELRPSLLGLSDGVAEATRGDLYFLVDPCEPARGAFRLWADPCDPCASQPSHRGDPDAARASQPNGSGGSVEAGSSRWSGAGSPLGPRSPGPGPWGESDEGSCFGRKVATGVFVPRSAHRMISVGFGERRFEVSQSSKRSIAP